MIQAEVKEPPSGLRERSKARRRAAIQRSAMRLFAERGYENTTLDDVAADADVARRTLAGYFPTKLSLASSFADELGERLAAAFQDRPDADVIEVFDRWLSEEFEHLDPETVRLARDMYAANPSLRALASAYATGAAQATRAGLLARMGLPDGDPLAAIAMSAFGAALTTYVFDILTLDAASPELHDALMRFLTATLDAAKELAPGRR